VTFSDAVVQAVWEKGAVVPGADPEQWRKDACGAWIARDPAGTYTN
jgi:hypothetical protein